MFKKSISLLVFCIPLLLKAQINVSVQLPPNGVVQKDQLWNLVLTNSGREAMNISILVTIRDVATGQPVLSAATRSILLAKGIKVLTANEVQPVQYDYGLNAQGNVSLPFGSYMACYTITRDVDGPQVVAEECIRFTVSPLSPLLLNTPSDKALIQTRVPQFTWLPPMPVTSYTSIEYEMTLVELKPGQGPVDALRQNTPVYTAAHQKSLFINYPASAPSLDTGKTYAWQVVAFTNQTYAVQSDIWSFRIRGNDVPFAAEEAVPFVRLKSEEDASLTLCREELRISYVNDCNDRSVDYEVVALQDGNRVVHHGTLDLIGGQNLIKIPFKHRELQSGKMYQFRLLNSRKESWTAKFIYSK